MLNHNLVFAIAMEVRNDQLNENGEVIKAGYSIYGIPVILNDSPCLLRVAYYPNEQKYQIVGARRNIKRGVGRTGRGFIELQKGDIVTPIFMAIIPEEDNDEPDTVIATLTVGDMKAILKTIKGKTFTINETPIVRDETINDGDYVYQFNFNSPRGHLAQSEKARFEVFDGEILHSEKVSDDLPEDKEPVKIEIGNDEYMYDPVTKEIVENDEAF